jgi:hypothetical protein
MKLVRVPAERSPVVDLTCAACEGKIDRREPALADIDADPRAAYYHETCLTRRPCVKHGKGSCPTPPDRRAAARG